MSICLYEELHKQNYNNVYVLFAQFIFVILNKRLVVIIDINAAMNILVSPPIHALFVINFVCLFKHNDIYK